MKPLNHSTNEDPCFHFPPFRLSGYTKAFGEYPAFQARMKQYKADEKQRKKEEKRKAKAAKKRLKEN